MNKPCLESQDIRRPSSVFKPEYEGYTPLMLAVVTERASLVLVKQLLAARATYSTRDKVTGDNILHLAARYCPHLEILEYLVKSLNQEMLFERNTKGDTPLSICVSLKNGPAIALLEKLQVVYDHTRQKTGDLLASLDAEAEKAERDH